VKSLYFFNYRNPLKMFNNLFSLFYKSKKSKKSYNYIPNTSNTPNIPNTFNMSKTVKNPKLFERDIESKQKINYKYPNSKTPLFQSKKQREQIIKYNQSQEQIIQEKGIGYLR
jgi:hypothetical protein